MRFSDGTLSLGVKPVFCSQGSGAQEVIAACCQTGLGGTTCLTLVWILPGAPTRRRLRPSVRVSEGTEVPLRRSALSVLPLRRSGDPRGTLLRLPIIKTCMGSCEAPEGTNTKVTSAKGHLCAYLSTFGSVRIFFGSMGKLASPCSAAPGAGRRGGRRFTVCAVGRAARHGVHIYIYIYIYIYTFIHNLHLGLINAPPLLFVFPPNDLFHY